MANRGLAATEALQGGRASGNLKATQRSTASLTVPTVKKAGILSNIPGWVWVVGFIILAILMLRKR
jgi:hypothetical protein